MKIPFVDLYSQYVSIKEEIDEAMANVIRETAFIRGKYVKQFEKDFEEKIGVKHCLSLANGTDAIYIALKMKGIGQGDEVITVANSWISSSETITQTGAKPVFVDIDDYFSIDADLIENHITERTKAIVPVHLHGQSVDMDKIMAICKKHNLFLVEDTAQAHFTEYKGKFAGTMGDVGTFSFYPGKNLGAYGDAGCSITNDSALVEKMRMYANHGALIKHQHHMEGINSRLDGLQAAILSVKLKYILQWTESRRTLAKYYNKALGEIEEIQTPLVRPETNHSYHVYAIKAQQRDELEVNLKSMGIGTNRHYPIILPLMPAYEYLGGKKEDFPVAYKAQQEILSLPMYPEMTTEMVDHISESIKEFYVKRSVTV